MDNLEVLMFLKRETPIHACTLLDEEGSSSIYSWVQGIFHVSSLHWTLYNNVHFGSDRECGGQLMIIFVR